MVKLTDTGAIVANCSSDNCQGAKTTYEYESRGSSFGVIGHFSQSLSAVSGNDGVSIEYRLFRCASCGRGAIAALQFNGRKYPGYGTKLLWFYPKSLLRLPLPQETPQGIQKEFREAETCMSHGCYRAAAGLFRSVLDKTLRHNDYKPEGNLKSQIDTAAREGIITEARKKRAHKDVRVLGNDVLHDDWHEISRSDVEATHHYMQRILEDFYDDRESVLELLKQAGRIIKEEAEQQA